MSTAVHPVLEKVARAMYEKHPVASPLEGEQWSWEWLVESNWAIVDTYRDFVRAAVQALVLSDELPAEFRVPLLPLVEGDGE